MKICHFLEYNANMAVKLVPDPFLKKIKAKHLAKDLAKTS